MKSKKKLLKRLLFVVTLAIVLTNCCYIIFGTNIGFANEGLVATMIDSEASAFAKVEALMSGIVAIFTFIPRILFLLIGFFIKIVMNACVSLGTVQVTSVSFEHVFFSGYKEKGGFSGIDFIDINFFDLEGEGAIYSFRGAVAQWYYIMRLISAAILLVILIYVGIRMALSTIASEQAKYKQMLTDWVTSLALLFLLHYIIMFVISINSALVSSLGGLLKNQMVEDVTIGEYLNSQLVTDIWTDGIGGIFAGFMYMMMQGSAFGFFLFYLKRMITVGFLIIIAPLITITYSIDKIGDGKAQALNAWLKEFVYNILIQPFHCILYLAFFGAIAQIIEDATYGNISAYILAYVILKFMKEAEGILRKIFHFEANSMPSVTQPAKAFAAATGKFAQVGMKGVGAFANFRAAGGMKAVTGGLRDIGAKRDVKKAFNAGEVNTTASTFKEFKKTDKYSELLEKKKTAREINARKNSRRTKKARKIYDKQQGREGAYDEMIENSARAAYDETHGAGAYDRMKNMASKKDRNGQPTKQARMAQETIDIQNGKIKEAKNSTIIGSTGFRKTINGAKTLAHQFTQSSAGKAIGAYVKDSAEIASALALGSFVYGVTDNATDAVSFGQLGYGMMHGALEGTNKTATKDTTDLVKQYAHNNNISPEDMKKMVQEFVNECHSMDFAGMFKKIHDDQVKAVEKLEDIVGDSASRIMSAMIAQTKTGEEFDISDLIDTYYSGDLADDEKEKAMNIVKEFSDLFIKSQVAAQFNVVKSGGMDVDSFGRKVTNNYNTTENNTTTYIYNYEENRYENRTQNGPQNGPQNTP